MLDGNAVHFDSVKFSLADSFTCSAKVVLDHSALTICTGPLSHGREVAEEPSFGVVTFHEEYNFQGGHLQVGSSDVVDSGDGAEYVQEDGSKTRRWVAVWEGARYSFHCGGFGGAWKAQELVAQLSRFSVHEGEHGIVLEDTTTGPLAFAKDPSITKWVPDLGYVQSWQLNQRTAKKVPRRSGTRVRGGELFVARKNTHDRYFVLVGKTSFSMFVPYGDFSGVRAKDTLEGLQDLLVSCDR